MTILFLACRCPSSWCTFTWKEWENKALQTLLSPITRISLLVPVHWGVRVSTYEFWEDKNIQSITITLKLYDYLVRLSFWKKWWNNWQWVNPTSFQTHSLSLPVYCSLCRSHACISLFMGEKTRNKSPFSEQEWVT